MIKGTRSINLLMSPDYPRTIRTKANIHKAKSRLVQRRRASTRKLAVEMCISRTSAQLMFRKDLSYFPYKKIKKPKVADLQKNKS